MAYDGGDFTIEWNVALGSDNSFTVRAVRLHDRHLRHCESIRTIQYLSGNCHFPDIMKLGGERKNRKIMAAEVENLTQPKGNPGHTVRMIKDRFIERLQRSVQVRSGGPCPIELTHKIRSGTWRDCSGG